MADHSGSRDAAIQVINSRPVLSMQFQAYLVRCSPEVMFIARGHTIPIHASRQFRRCTGPSRISNNPSSRQQLTRACFVQAAKPRITVGLDFGTTGTGFAFSVGLDAGNIPASQSSMAIKEFHQYPDTPLRGYPKDLTAVLYKVRLSLRSQGGFHFCGYLLP